MNFQRACLGAIAVLSLGACDQLSSQQAKQVAPTTDEKAGRWIVIPATSNPVMNQGTPFMFAWRLDTKTGALQMCTYDPGGWTNTATKMPMPDNLNCTPSKPASPSESGGIGQDEIEAEIKRRGLDDPLGIRGTNPRR
jgi:hypothetical protein